MAPFNINVRLSRAVEQNKIWVFISNFNKISSKNSGISGSQ
jgi:hypothetical protein